MATSTVTDRRQGNLSTTDMNVLFKDFTILGNDYSAVYKEAVTWRSTGTPKIAVLYSKHEI
jgi:hypothetical protein